MMFPGNPSLQDCPESANPKDTYIPHRLHERLPEPPLQVDVKQVPPLRVPSLWVPLLLPPLKVPLSQVPPLRVL